MLELCRRTLQLFRKYPVLWVPYFCAELLVIGVGVLREIALRGMFEWLSTSRSRSVLGGEIITQHLNHSAQIRAGIASIALGFWAELLNVCLFVSALVVTAAMVKTILEQQRPNLAEGFRAVTQRWGRIGAFSLKFAIAYFLLNAIFASPLLFLLNTTRVAGLEASPILGYVALLADLAVIACLGWLFASDAVRLLQVPGVEPVSRAVNRQAIGATLVAAVLAMLLRVLFQAMESTMMLGSNVQREVASILTAVLVRATFIPLFIALALLAAKERGLPATETAPSLLQDNSW